MNSSPVVSDSAGLQLKPGISTFIKCHKDGPPGAPPLQDPQQEGVSAGESQWERELSQASGILKWL